MGRRCTPDGELTRRYAAARGIAVRTARLHRSKNAPEWRAWVEGQAAEESAPVGAGATHDLARARDAVERFFSAWEKLAAAVDKASADTAPALVKATADAYKSYELARANLKKLEAEAGELLPRAAFVKLVHHISGGLATAFHALPNVISTHLLPEQRGAFYLAWSQSTRQWDLQMDALQNLAYELLANAGSPQK